MTGIVSSGEKVGVNRLWWVAVLAGLTAAALNLLVFWVAGALGVNPQIPATPGSAALSPLTAVPVVAASFVPALFAGLFLAALGRFTRRPLGVFLIVAGVLGLFSLGGPLGMPVDGGTKVVLSLMHLTAAAAISGVLVRFARA